MAQLLPLLLAVAPAWGGASPQPRLPAGYLQVPLTYQTTNYSCGAAALLAITRYWGVFVGKEHELYGLLNTTPEEGTHPASIVAGAEHFGLKARIQEGTTFADLEMALAKGETVILDIQAWPANDVIPDDWEKYWEDGHYVVLVGLDRDFVYVMDPSTHLAYGYIPRAEFLTRWHDYENEAGKRREYRRMVIRILGKDRIKSFPAPLERIR